MTAITVIRSEQIGNKLGLVIASDEDSGHEAKFQLYYRNHSKPAMLDFVLSQTYYNDEDAIAFFDVWRAETAMLRAAGE